MYIFIVSGRFVWLFVSITAESILMSKGLLILLLQPFSYIYGLHLVFSSNIQLPELSNYWNNLKD